MVFEDLRDAVVRRLDEGDRGDRGWFLITRVHLSADRLQDIATYLYALGAATDKELTQADYRALAQAAGVTTADPGITLRRHYLLAMEKPLQLLRRLDGRYWRMVQLSDLGIRLATDPNTAAVLDDALNAVRFCREPWYSTSRVDEYSQFDVAAYPVTLQVMGECGGWVDRDEYDLFLSRIRHHGEVEWAIAGIHAFRQLDQDERLALLGEVRARIPGAKAYQNWRDMALHVFSLFDLGVSAARREQRLVLASALVETVPAEEARRRTEELARTVRRDERPAAGRRLVRLQIPAPLATDELAVPPPEPTVNPGTQAELIVGKLLQAAGWHVVYYTNRRGFGFDIYAEWEGSAIVVEVKSGTGEVGTLALTEHEYEAARHYHQNYILAIVEFVGTEPSIRLIQDPASVLTMEERTTLEYTISRVHWLAVPEFRPTD